MEPLTIIFIGPQGSGKGTQVSNLLKTLGEKSDRRTIDVQTGRGFRAMIESPQTFAEKKVASTLAGGKLQPDFLTNQLWIDHMLKELDSECNLLIDGFPRTVAQAGVLDEALDFFERQEVHVINLDTPEEIVRERMKSRGRADDTDESIDTRLRMYREDTLPVLEYYRTRPHTQVHDLDGTDTIEGVHAQILAALQLV